MLSEYRTAYKTKLVNYMLNAIVSDREERSCGLLVYTRTVSAKKVKHKFNHHRNCYTHQPYRQHHSNRTTICKCTN